MTASATNFNLQTRSYASAVAGPSNTAINNKNGKPEEIKSVTRHSDIVLPAQTVAEKQVEPAAVSTDECCKMASGENLTLMNYFQVVENQISSSAHRFAIDQGNSTEANDLLPDISRLYRLLDSYAEPGNSNGLGECGAAVTARARY